MISRPRLSVTLSGLHRRLGHDPRVYVDVARIAEDVGIDQVLLTDHVVMGERTDRYPFGKFPFTPDEPWIEPLTMLAAMAQATSRVRLGTGILVAPLRPAVLLAKTVATLDALSGGRIDLGVGVGWQREEYDAIGIPFEGRWQRLDDTLRACRVLWSGGAASFESPTVRFDRIHCAPVPTQARIPIWFGAAASDALARRIAELGDGWMPLGAMSPDDVKTHRRLFEAAFVAAGRSPDELGVRAGLPLVKDANGGVDVARTMETVPALADSGVTSFSVIVGPGLADMDDVRRFLTDVAARMHAPRGAPTPSDSPRGSSTSGRATPR